MKVLGIIPARGGSKGVPGKNIKPLLGKPLIVHTLEAAMASRLSRVIVSTDSAEITETAKKWGAEVPFVRPAELSGDNATSISVAIHALQEMEKQTGEIFDAVMLLQPTTPLRTAEDINEALDIMQSMQSDSVISVVDVGGQHPARMKYLKDGWLLDPPFCEEKENQNRQELMPMYIRNGAIYLTRRDILLGESYKGIRCAAYVMPAERSVNIDTLRDFEYAEWTAQRKKP